MTAANKKRYHRPYTEAGKKIADAHIGRVHPTLRGKPLSDEHKAKIRAARHGAIPAHGTRARYKGSLRRDPCRCARCRKEWSDYRRELRRPSTR
jgi:hypothetical protein